MSADAPAARDADRVLADVLDAVAEAANLQEGGAGVQRVLQAFRQLEVASTQAVSRHAGLPLPVTAAVSNELRSRGFVSRERPSRLTAQGADLLAGVPDGPDVDPTCPQCAGDGMVVPAALAGVVAQLCDVMATMPSVDVSLDQSHCTAETKLRRVLMMIRRSVLPTSDLLLIGDDDLMGVAVAMVGAALGRPLVRQLGIVDISADLLDFIQDRLTDLDQQALIVRQDLRVPLDPRLVGRFEVVMTDPPYTPEGGRLFLSRAVEGLRPGPGRSVVFSFGPKGPGETLHVQREVTELGLTVQAMHPNFNTYHGAGVIGSRSHLYHLGTTELTRPVVTGSYAGAMYTADKRAAAREFICLHCRARHVVGPGAQWRYVSTLKEAGCPICGGRRFRPLQLVSNREVQK